jgi:hypothetical protein
MEDGSEMGSLPEDLWVQILLMGSQNGQLHYRDLCALAITSKRLNRICELDIIWRELLAQDFPEPVVPSSSSLATDSAAAAALCSLRRKPWSEVSQAACKKQYRSRLMSFSHFSVFPRQVGLSVRYRRLFRLKRGFRNAGWER